MVNTVKMNKMPIGSIGVIVSDNSYKGEIVRRSLSTSVFLVECISEPQKDFCWTSKRYANYEVSILPYAKLNVNPLGYKESIYDRCY